MQQAHIPSPLLYDWRIPYTDGSKINVLENGSKRALVGAGLYVQGALRFQSSL